MVQPKHKTYKEAYADLAANSFCAAKVIGSLKNPKLIHIKFKGPIAHIPALKNQKIRFTNVLRPEAKAALDLMTRSFQRSVNFNIPQYSNDIKLFCLILCAVRKRNFDEDNVLTTIRDWLEPSWIRKKNRGWGVGVVKNDKNINAYAVKKTNLNAEPEVTEIYIMPLDSIKESLDELLLKIIAKKDS